MQRSLFKGKPRREGAGIKAVVDFSNDPKYGGAYSRSNLAFAVYALDHGVPESQVRAQIASQDLSYVGSHARQQDYVERVIQKAINFLNAPAIGR